MGWLPSDEPGVYRVTLEIADGRWWVALAVANNPAEAERLARGMCPHGIADLVFCDFTTEMVPPMLLSGELQVPRGWEPPKEAP